MKDDTKEQGDTHRNGKGHEVILAIEKGHQQTHGHQTCFQIKQVTDNLPYNLPVNQRNFCFSIIDVSISHASTVQADALDQIVDTLHDKAFGELNGRDMYRAEAISAMAALAVEMDMLVVE